MPSAMVTLFGHSGEIDVDLFLIIPRWCVTWRSKWDLLRKGRDTGYSWQERQVVASQESRWHSWKCVYKYLWRFRFHQLNNLASKPFLSSCTIKLPAAHVKKRKSRTSSSLLLFHFAFFHMQSYIALYPDSTSLLPFFLTNELCTTRWWTFPQFPLPLLPTFSHSLSAFFHSRQTQPSSPRATSFPSLAYLSHMLVSSNLTRVSHRLDFMTHNSTLTPAPFFSCFTLSKYDRGCG